MLWIVKLQLYKGGDPLEEKIDLEIKYQDHKSHLTLFIVTRDGPSFFWTELVTSFSAGLVKV